MLAQLQHVAEHGDPSAGRFPGGQHGEGSGHGLRPRVVAVGDHGKAALLIDVLAVAGVAEPGQPGGDLLRLHAAEQADQNRGEGVADVVQPGDGQDDREPVSHADCGEAGRAVHLADLLRPQVAVLC